MVQPCITYAAMHIFLLVHLYMGVYSNCLSYLTIHFLGFFEKNYEKLDNAQKYSYSIAQVFSWPLPS